MQGDVGSFHGFAIFLTEKKVKRNRCLKLVRFVVDCLMYRLVTGHGDGIPLGAARCGFPWRFADGWLCQ